MECAKMSDATKTGPQAKPQADSRSIKRAATRAAQIKARGGRELTASEKQVLSVLSQAGRAFDVAAESVRNGNGFNRQLAQLAGQSIAASFLEVDA
jgi:hypothetical protein